MLRVIIFGFYGHVFGGKGSSVVYIVTYHVMHIVEGAASIILTKIPAQN